MNPDYLKRAVLTRVSSLLMEPATIAVLARSEESGSRDYLARQFSVHFRV